MKSSVQYLIHVTYIALIACAITSCGGGDHNSKEDQSQDPVVTALHALEKEVIDVHDEVMPKMAMLNNTRVKLIKQYEDENLSAVNRTDLSRAIMHLVEADSLMWDWMHNYNRPDYDGNLDSIRVYLEKEKITVTIMKKKFFSSMEEGETLLAKYREDDQ